MRKPVQTRPPFSGRAKRSLSAASVFRPVWNAKFALPALLALAAVLLLLAPDRSNVAEAGRFDPVLATNMGQNKISADVNDGLSQAFTTGSNSGGYTITQIQMESNDAQGDDFTMQVCVADSNEEPTSDCTVLTGPDSFARGRLTFTAPGGLISKPPPPIP